MTDSRAGFALVAVLWLVAALAVLVSVGLRPAQLASASTANRIGEMRAVWAARGCLALVQAGYEADHEVAPTGQVALGPATSCEATAFEWDERVNPNVADSVGLLRVLGDTVQVSSILDWIDGDDEPRPLGAEAEWYVGRSRLPSRNAPFASVAELQYVRGFEGTSLEALENVFTVRGDGGVSPDRASARVLSSVSVLSAPDIARLVTLRSASGPFRSAEQVSVLLGLAPTVAEFRELRERLSIRPGDHTVRIEGWSDVGSRTVRSRLETTLTPVNGRLAVTDLEIR